MSMSAHEGNKTKSRPRHCSSLKISMPRSIDFEQRGAVQYDSSHDRNVVLHSAVHGLTWAGQFPDLHREKKIQSRLPCPPFELRPPKWFANGAQMQALDYCCDHYCRFSNMRTCVVRRRSSRTTWRVVSFATLAPGGLRIWVDDVRNSHWRVFCLQYFAFMR